MFSFINSFIRSVFKIVPFRPVVNRRKEIEKKRIDVIRREAPTAALAISGFQFGEDTLPSVSVSDARICVTDEMLREVMDEMDVDQQLAYKALKRSRNNKTLAIKYLRQQIAKFKSVN